MICLSGKQEAVRRLYDTRVFHRHTLDNGVRVLMQEPSILPTRAGILSLVVNNVGSQCDPLDRRGTAHFTEHRVLGDHRNPHRGKLVGGTDGDYTYAAVEFRECDREKAIAALGIPFLSPDFSDTSVFRERGIIEAEYRKTFSLPRARQWDAVMRSLYGLHSLGHRALGDLSTIRSMESDELRGFYDRYYHAGNFTLVAAGSYAARGQSNNTLVQLNEAFGRLKTDKPFVPTDEGLPFEARGENEINLHGATHDSLFLLYPMRPPTNRDDSAWTLTAKALGNGPGSWLDAMFRDRLGVSYNSTFCYLFQARHIWVFAVVIDLPEQERKNRVVFYHRARTIFEKALKQLEDERIIAAQQSRQIERDLIEESLSFGNNIKAFSQIVSDLPIFNRIRSWHEREALEDNVTIADVRSRLQWLRETSPFEVIVC